MHPALYWVSLRFSFQLVTPHWHFGILSYQQTFIIIHLPPWSVPPQVSFLLFHFWVGDVFLVLALSECFAFLKQAAVNQLLGSVSSCVHGTWVPLSVCHSDLLPPTPHRTCRCTFMGVAPWHHLILAKRLHELSQQRHHFLPSNQQGLKTVGR